MEVTERLMKGAQINQQEWLRQNEIEQNKENLICNQNLKTN